MTGDRARCAHKLSSWVSDAYSNGSEPFTSALPEMSLAQTVSASMSSEKHQHIQISELCEILIGRRQGSAEAIRAEVSDNENQRDAEAAARVPQGQQGSVYSSWSCASSPHSGGNVPEIRLPAKFLYPKIERNESRPQ